jgi:putative endonuclease
MFTVYVLQSLASGKVYAGFPADLVQRVGQHNSGITESTKCRGPWCLVYREEYPNGAEAMRREKHLKSGRGREELRLILKHERCRNSAG